MFLQWLLLLLLLQLALFLLEHICASVLGLGFRFQGFKPPAMCDKAAALHYDTPLSHPYEYLKVALLLASGLAPLRLLQGIIFFTLGVAAANVAVMVPSIPIWFSFWKVFVWWTGRGILFSLGFYKLSITGAPAPREEVKIFVGNHVCAIEAILLFMCIGFPSFISRVENLTIPLFGGLLRATRSILVDRSDHDSRLSVLTELRRRCLDPTFPQIMIFPEGTTNNQHTLFRFKKGCFEAGCPVQMVCFKYPYRHFNPCWTGRSAGGNDLTDLLLRCLTQFANRVHIKFLPVYTPTQEHAGNGQAYADYTMRVIAGELGICVSDACYEDYVALMKPKRT